MLFLVGNEAQSILTKHGTNIKKAPRKMRELDNFTAFVILFRSGYSRT